MLTFDSGMLSYKEVIVDKDINRVVGGKYCGAEISWVNNSLAFV